MRRLLPLAFAVGFVLFGLVRQGPAEPIWAKLITSNKVQADPNKSYKLSEEMGPWLIVAATFSGDGAQTQARELMLELRRRYKLPAYLHDRTFDFTDPVRGRGVDRFGNPKRMRYQRELEIHEIAVLVGDFPSVADPEAQKTLKKIKFLQPDSLLPEKRERTNQTLAALRRIQTALLPDGSERKKMGPMAKAFMTRNPLLPEELFAPQGVDSFVEKMNENVKYSLLDCPGKYTLQVATFRGNSVIDQEKIEAIESGKSLKSKLAKAAENAEKLAMALRSKGYEAYSFHDRSASIVTVGSFASAGVPRADGKVEINPRIHQLMETFKASPRDQKLPIKEANPYAALKPKTLLGIPFDLQPQMVHVPKRSISAAYARGSGSR